MGTRNVIAVFYEGRYKIAQYGQWDGCPEGQGRTVLNFLSDAAMVESLKANLSKVRCLDREKDKYFLEAYDNNAPEWSNDPDNRTLEQKRWWSTYMDRNLGAKILFNIAKSRDQEIWIRDSINFCGELLMCEWVYVIDLDSGNLEVYKGFNKMPLTKDDRFFDLPISDGYQQVKIVKSYPLTDLPTAEQMITDCNKDEEEEE